MLLKKIRKSVLKTSWLLLPFISSSIVLPLIFANNKEQNSIERTNLDSNSEVDTDVADENIKYVGTSRIYGDYYGVQVKFNSKANIVNYESREATNFDREFKNIKIMSQKERKEMIFTLRKQDGNLYPEFIEDVPIVDTWKDSSPLGFWGVNYVAVGRSSGEYAPNFLFGKNESGYSPGIVNKDNKPCFNGSETAKYEGKKLEGVLYLSQVSYWRPIGYYAPYKHLRVIDINNNEKYAKDSNASFYDSADQSGWKWNWMSDQIALIIFDGKIWSSTRAKSSFKIELKNKIFTSITVDQFLDNFKNPSTIKDILQLNFLTTPSLCIDGKDGEGSVINAWDDEKSKKVIIEVSTPYKYEMKNSRQSMSDKKSHLDNTFSDYDWFKNEGMTQRVEIDYSAFAPRPEKQEFTTVKENIVISDFTELDPTLNSKVYSIDFLTRLKEKNILAELINKKPELILNNPPSKKECGDRPICNKNFTITGELDTENSTVVKITANVLVREKFSSRPAYYKIVNFKIGGFCSDATTTKDIIDCSGTSLSKLSANAIFDDTIELLDFIKNQDTLRKIFYNAPDEFYKYNAKNIKITRVSNRSLFDGTVYVELMAYKYAYGSPKARINGYSDISAIIKISGLFIPPNTTVKPTLNIADLNIDGIDDLTYSIDVVKIDKIKKILIKDMNTNRSKYAKNLWDIGDWNEQFTNMNFTYNQNSVEISGMSIEKVDNGKFIKGKFETQITGFNTQNTAIISDYRPENESNEGYKLNGFEYTSATDALFNNTYLEKVYDIIKKNLSLIYENYSQYFVQYNRKNLQIDIVDVDNLKGEATLELTAQYAYVDGEYKELKSLLKVCGFKKYNEMPTYEISTKKNNLLININKPEITPSSLTVDEVKKIFFDQRNNIFNFTGKFLDIDNPIWWNQNIVIDNIYPDDKTGTVEIKFTLTNASNGGDTIKNSITLYNLCVVDYKINFISDTLILDNSYSTKEVVNLSKYDIRQLIIANKDKIFSIPKDFVHINDQDWWNENLDIRTKNKSNLWGTIVLELTLKNSNSYGASITSDFTIIGFKNKLEFNTNYCIPSDDSNVSNVIDGRVATLDGMVGFDWNIYDQSEREKLAIDLLKSNWKTYIFNDAEYFDIISCSYSAIKFDDNNKSIEFFGLRLTLEPKNIPIKHEQKKFSTESFYIKDINSDSFGNISNSLITSNESSNNFDLWLFVGVLSATCILILVIIWLLIKSKKENKNIGDDFLDI